VLTAAAKKLQKENLVSLGREGGLSRVIAMMDVAASLGMLLGPILGGSLMEHSGYEDMCFIWSR
jgi:MFS family permease